MVSGTCLCGPNKGVTSVTKKISSIMMKIIKKEISYTRRNCFKGVIA
jgi:hypothetical protein